MPGAVAPPGGHSLTEPSRFQLRKGSKRQGTHLYENPPALWTGTGRETGKHTRLDLCGGSKWWWVFSLDFHHSLVVMLHSLCNGAILRDSRTCSP